MGRNGWGRGGRKKKERKQLDEKNTTKTIDFCSLEKQHDSIIHIDNNAVVLCLCACVYVSPSTTMGFKVRFIFYFFIIIGYYE